MSTPGDDAIVDGLRYTTENSGVGLWEAGGNDTATSLPEMLGFNATSADSVSSSTDLNMIGGDLNSTTASIADITTSLADLTTTLIQPETSIGAMTTSNFVGPSVAIAASFFMVLFLVAALVGNVACLLALAHKSMDKTIMYTFLGNLCTSQLCDCLLCMTLVSGASATGHWPYGVFVCQVSAFLLNLLNVETVLALTLLALDRVLVMSWGTVYANTSRTKVSLIIGYTWLHAAIFTIFLLAGVIPVEYFPDCYICSLSAQAPVVYVVFFTLFCYMIPVVLITSIGVLVCKVAVDEKPTVQHFNAEVHYANQLGRRSELWRELRQAKTIGVLVLLWFLLQAPYLVLQSIYLFSMSDYPNQMNNIFASQVKTAFTWMRFCYPWIAPLAILIGFKEIRAGFLNYFACYKNNMVDSGRQEVLVEPGVRKSWASSSDASRHSSVSHPLTQGQPFQVPVLFATSGGLRLQIGNNQRENDVNKAMDYTRPDDQTDVFRADPGTKYLPPFTPVPHISDDDSLDSQGVDGESSPVQRSGTTRNATLPSEPDHVRSPSSSASSFQLSLTGRELKVRRDNGPNSSTDET